jgi:hypothetical protein
MRTMRHFGSVALVIVLLAGAAHAQDAAAAEALFREGRELMEAKDYGAACPKFAESKRLDASSGTSLNLADCYDKQGKTASAWAEFLIAARLAQSQGNPGRADEAGRRAKELESKLSFLTVRVSQKVSGLEVQRDDVTLEAATIGSKIPTDPGHHVIKIQAPGYKSLELEVTVGKAGDSQTLTVPALTKDDASAEPPASHPATATPKPGSAPPPPGPDRPPPSHGSTRTIAYVAGGVGIAATAVGVIFGLGAKSAYDEASSMCPSHTSCSDDALSQRDKADTRATIANVGFGVGIVGIGLATVLLITSSGSEKAAGEGPKRSLRRSGIDFAPTVGASGAGVWIRGPAF